MRNFLERNFLVSQVNFIEETVANKASPTITTLTQDKSHDKTRHDTARRERHKKTEEESTYKNKKDRIRRERQNKKDRQTTIQENTRKDSARQQKMTIQKSRACICITSFFSFPALS